MLPFQISFDHPGYLWLLALVPLMWAISFGPLRVLGNLRRLLVLGLRSAVLLTIVFSLAGVQLVWTTERVTVLYLLDQSESIPAARREQMLQFVTKNVREYRDAEREDRAGLIVFGRNANLAVPPFSDELPLVRESEGDFGPRDATNLEEALELANASMPEDSRRRIVILTDGNETIGDAKQVAARLAAAGVGIDVIPVPAFSGADVLVEKIDLPGDIRNGQPFEARVVMSNFTPARETTDASAAKPTRGRLSITRSSGGEDQLLLDQEIELEPGKNVIPIKHTIDQPAAFTFSAKFTPLDSTDDAQSQNNEATAYTYVRGKGRVLLIEPFDTPGIHAMLVEQLRKSDIEVVVQPSNQLFGSLAELQAFDVVILANVPRTSGDSASTLTQFTEDQMQMLVRNTQQLGAGLLMIGGPDSLGVGGWTRTPIEEAMPIDFEIKNTKVVAIGALMLVIDSSGSMDGEKMSLCKIAAREAVKGLSPADSIGVISFDGETHEIVPLQTIGERTHILPLISRIQPGGGTIMYPALQQAYRQLERSNASVKHMIVLTDGQTSPDRFQELAREMKKKGITVTSVAIGSDADTNLMRELAVAGGGKFFHVLSPRAIPQVVMREARRVSRPLIYENASGISPIRTAPHAILNGIDINLPPITGYVMSTPKNNPLVQTLLESPLPEGQQNPILSVWQYGLGRTAVLSTDSGERWAASWANWPGHEKFFSQLIRWLMRPTGDTGKYTIATQIRDGQVQVIVNALNKEDEYLNFLTLSGAVIGPDLKPTTIELTQSAPGRYVGSFAAVQAGSYFVNVVPEGTGVMLSTGVSVPFGDEYRAREMNEPLMQTLASYKPAKGEPGAITVPLASDTLDQVMQSNPYRDGLAKTGAIQDVWPWFLLAACAVFVLDVMLRRVSIDFGWLTAMLRRFRRQAATEPAQPARLDALLNAKRTVAPETQSWARFEASDEVVEDSARRAGRPEAPGTGPTSAARPSNMGGGSSGTAAGQELSYTERLLEAKRRAKK